MANTSKEPVRFPEHLATVAVILPVAVLSAVLWLIAAPLLPRATAASLVMATFVSLASALQTGFTLRRGWRKAITLGLIQFIFVWPLMWLGFSYLSRHR